MALTFAYVAYKLMLSKRGQLMVLKCHPRVILKMRDREKRALFRPFRMGNSKSQFLQSDDGFDMWCEAKSQN